MKIGIIGITGRMGVRLANQAVKQGFQVVGMNRRPERIEIRLGKLPVETFKGDTDNIEDLVKLMKDTDVVIHATAPTRECPEKYVEGIKNTLIAAEKSQVQKLIFIGNSFTLKMANGKTYMHNKVLRSNFSKLFDVYPKSLSIIKENQTVNWTVAIPPVNMFPYGAITTDYVITDDQLAKEITIENIEEKNRISMEDFASIILKEAVENKFNHQCFSATY